MYLAMYIAATVSLSHFLRHSGEVLVRAEEGDVVLQRRDADDLVLTTVPRAEALRRALELVASIFRDVLDDDDGRRVVATTMGRSAAWTVLLHSDEKLRFARDLASAAATAAELDATYLLHDILERWRGVAHSRARPRPASAHTTRPVAIPDDVDDPAVEKAKGVVDLPLHVRWSTPRRTYDLDEPRQLRRVYEQVLREGNEEDVRRFIDVDRLLLEWDELVLPPRVRRAWAEWLRRRRNADVTC